MAPAVLAEPPLPREGRPADEEALYDSPTVVRILSASDSLSGGELLPGFSFPLASLFDRAATA
jgi:hypothetical protein